MAEEGQRIVRKRTQEGWEKVMGLSGRCYRTDRKRTQEGPEEVTGLSGRGHRNGKIGHKKVRKM